VRSQYQVIAENQPYTHVIETIRALTTGGITVTSYIAAVYLFKRKATR
jgi:hypothetical protein